MTSSDIHGLMFIICVFCFLATIVVVAAIVGWFVDLKDSIKSISEQVKRLK